MTKNKTELKKFRIHYVAEVEAEEQKNAEVRVELSKNLLQHYRTEELSAPKIADIVIDPKKEFKIFLELLNIKEDSFYDIDKESITLLYENRATAGVIYKASTFTQFYDLIFYIPRNQSNVQVVKCISAPNMSTTEAVIGKLIGEDLKNEPNIDNPTNEF